jgi:hypothetical protein
MIDDDECGAVEEMRIDKENKYAEKTCSSATLATISLT